MFSSAVVVAVVESAGTHPGENSVSVICLVAVSIAVVGAAVSAAGGRRFAAGVAAASGVCDSLSNCVPPSEKDSCSESCELMIVTSSALQSRAGVPSVGGWSLPAAG